MPKSTSPLIEPVDGAQEPPRAESSDAGTRQKKRKEKKSETEPTEPVRLGFNAIVVGGTGAVGRYVVQELLDSDNWSRVIVVGRRSGIPDFYPPSEKLVEIVGDLGEMTNSTSAVSEALKTYEVHAAFCCLGTTMKEAKSKANFKRVDYQYVTDFAWTVRQFRVPSFHLISSTGASSSSAFLYLRTKGKAEDYIKALQFPATLIYRPGLLGRDAPTSIEVTYSKVSTVMPAHFFARVITMAPIDIFQAHPSMASRSELATLAPGTVMFKESWDNDKIFKFAKTHAIPKEKWNPKKKQKDQDAPQQ